MRPLVVGTRGSRLACWQTDFVVAALKAQAPDLVVETRVIKTAGDRDPERPLDAFGTRGIFTDALREALRDGQIDLAVHSLKDIPTNTDHEFVLAAILERADARDVIVSRHKLGLASLPKNARIGTGSTRRTAQVLALRPDVTVLPLRGNVDSRLEKAKTEQYDAIVLAAAGVLRLRRAEEITEYLPLDTFLPDPGQGALAVQIRAADIELAKLCARIDDANVRAATTAERAFLAEWGSGCALPVGAYAEVNGEALVLRGVIGARDGTKMLRGVREGWASEAEEVGRELARELDGGIGWLGG